ncbi:MAG: hypothetical protein H7Z12_09160 [Rhodospirillaceae bacterium]|nr:hypothetical protein [Rhodospirillales bacterium]
MRSIGTTGLPAADHEDVRVLASIELSLKRWLKSELAEVPYPKGVVLVRNGFLHRLHTIDCEIAVRLWAAEHGHAVDYLSSYFDVTGANRSKTQPRRRSLTKIDLADGTGIIPDSVFHLTDPDGMPRLFVLEMYNQWRDPGLFSSPGVIASRTGCESMGPDLA